MSPFAARSVQASLMYASRGRCHLHRCQPSSGRAIIACQARRSSAAMRELEDLEDELRSDAAPSGGNLEWTSPLTLDSILKYPNPQLRAANAKVEVFGPPLKKLADEMFNVMYLDDGVGLAAPQVGINLRLMVFNESGVRGKGEEMVLANPRIISTNKLTDVMSEECLSFKSPRDSVAGNVARPTRIKVKAQGVDGHALRITLEGFAARLFQHEYDHLQGVLFPDRFDVQTLRRERPRLEALEKEFARSYPGVEYASLVARLDK